ncbi:MAG TPA: AMP-binding protein, partial [Streptosporangiaceae bacterium]
MPDLLTLYASTQPDKLAVIDDRGNGEVFSWTYAQLEAEANRLANALAGLGVSAGEKVIWCGPNAPQVVAVMNATRKIGAVAVPLNYRLTREEAQYIVVHSDAVAAFVDAEYAHLFAMPGGGRLGQLRQVVVYGGQVPDGMLSQEELVAGAPDGLPGGQENESGGATMIYTSGTTGKPKGALRRSAADPAQLGAMIQLIG